MKNIPIELIIVILAVLYMIAVNGGKTQIVLEANAKEGLQFGQLLEETQEQYRDLYLLQKSVSICEGGLNVDSLAYRNNNPGNLKAGGRTDNQGHTIYKSRLAGYMAHLSLLERKYWGQTPLQMNKRYATDPNWYECVNFYYLRR